MASSDEAQLIVSLIGIRDPAGPGNVANDRCLRFLVANGPKLSDALFARMPRAYRPRRALAKRLEGPSASSPAWQFEACGLQNYFKEDEAVANIVDDFAGVLLATTTGSAGQ